jgi:hypothetical protein
MKIIKHGCFDTEGSPEISVVETPSPDDLNDPSARVLFSAPDLGKDRYRDRHGKVFCLATTKDGKYYIQSPEVATKPTEGRKPQPTSEETEAIARAHNKVMGEEEGTLARALASGTEWSASFHTSYDCMTLEDVDVSTWSELGDFFCKPHVRSTLCELSATPGLPGHRQVLPMSWLCVLATNKEDAVKVLRRQLLTIHSNPNIMVHAFLQTPVIKTVVSKIKEGETPTDFVTLDLGPPYPAVKAYAAFCSLAASATFLDDADRQDYYGTVKDTGMTMRPLSSPQDWARRGITIARLEGSVGERDADL